MPPASQDSQGLKIAVAAFVTLTVILAVVSYFLYSSYDQTANKLTAAQEEARKKGEAANLAITQYDELRKQIGSRAEDFDAVKAEIKAEYKKLDDAITALPKEVMDSVSKVQAVGANSPDLQDVVTRTQQTAAAYLNEPNKNDISSLARLTDLLRSQVMLTTALSQNYLDVRRNLEAANDVNAKKLEVAETSFNTSKTDLETEQKRHVDERASLIKRVDDLSTENANQATEIANLNTKMRQMEEEFQKKLGTAQLMIRQFRAKAEETANVLDRPDGHITYVDYRRGEVHADVTYGTGARPQMVFTIFDRNAPGIPTERPKGTIELLQVNDRESIGRIVKTFNMTDPIRDGDIVYSPTWSPNEPERIALIGKLDLNRDNRDDRADLKRLIQSAGGIVAYDLPPPDAGRESGDLNLIGLCAWYVIDDRDPLVSGLSERERSPDTPEYAAFLKLRARWSAWRGKTASDRCSSRAS